MKGSKKVAPSYKKTYPADLLFKQQTNAAPPLPQIAVN